MASLSWQPELQLLQTVSASAAALEGVLVASTSSGDAQIPSGPSSSTRGIAKASLRVVKGSCSVLHRACTLACRSISEKVKILQRSGNQEDALNAVDSSAKGSGNGLEAHELGSSVDSPKQHQLVAAGGDGRSSQNRKKGGRKIGKPTDSNGDSVIQENAVVKGVTQQRVQVTDTGSQTVTKRIYVEDMGSQTEAMVEADMRRSDRLKEKAERGFLNDKISDLDSHELRSRKEVMHDAWKDYDMADELTLTQYLKIACLVCEGFLRKGPGGGAWYSAKRNWRVWEPFVIQAEKEKYGPQ